MSPILEIRDLNVDYGLGSGAVRAVRDVNLVLERGQVLGKDRHHVDPHRATSPAADSSACASASVGLAVCASASVTSQIKS